MPELPEIESLRAKIAPKLKNVRIRHVAFRRADLRYPLPHAEAKRLANRGVLGVRRRSKYLLLDLSGSVTLVIHLGMSGRFFFAAPDLPFDAHDHVVIDLADGRQLRLRDPRRFGMLFLCATDKLGENRFFKHLGVEPLDGNFSGDYLHTLCHGTNTSIKSLLMDAKRVVGIGNIYANEALFLSGVRPGRRAHTLTRVQTGLLCENVKKVLRASIAAGGTSFRDYVDADQKPGLHQLDLYVYGREGEPCRSCQIPVKRVVQGQRSSFYCPKCQK